MSKKSLAIFSTLILVLTSIFSGILNLTLVEADTSVVNGSYIILQMHNIETIFRLIIMLQM